MLQDIITYQVGNAVVIRATGVLFSVPMARMDAFMEALDAAAGGKKPERLAEAAHVELYAHELGKRTRKLKDRGTDARVRYTLETLDKAVRMVLEDGYSADTVAEVCGMSRAYVYKLVQQRKHDAELQDAGKEW